MKGREKERTVFRIGAIAERYGIHPQTLRMYEREGLLKPARTGGNTRLYDSVQSLAARLRAIHDFAIRLNRIRDLDEIASVIEEEIRKYRTEVDLSEVGKVLEVGDGIARIYGLTGAMAEMNTGTAMP